MHEVTHIEPGLAVVEHFDDPKLHGFESKAEPAKPEDVPATSGNPDDKKGA